ncbi:hypothetical protein RHEC894_PC00342 (plasmid) [Rhizobium sp. CIAT894]|nr:hypothetical protein RHEC894_PC00342 [Rhizobium sp. CIAT894]
MVINEAPLGKFICGLSVTANTNPTSAHTPGHASVMPFGLKEMDLRSAQGLRRRTRALLVRASEL